MDFIVKQALGGATKDLNKLMDDKKDVDPRQAAAEREQLEALAEAEAERKAKYLKIEKEREEYRQTIRDKYGLKSKKQIAEEEAAARERALHDRLNRKPAFTAQQTQDCEDEDDEKEEEETLLSQAEKALGELQQKVVTAKEAATENCKIS